MNTAELLERNPFAPQEEDDLIQLTIPRDLAVPIVGSDAGKERRFRPAATMTKNMSPEELAQVEALTRPFLDAEIHRFHTNRSERMGDLAVTATPEQALALLTMCTDYAAHLQKHWQKNGHNPRHHRSKQRLDQARDVIRQINRGLGHGDNDGRTTHELRSEVAEQLSRLVELTSQLLDQVSRVTNDNAEDALPRDEVEFWRDCHNELQTLASDSELYE